MRCCTRQAESTNIAPPREFGTKSTHFLYLSSAPCSILPIQSSAHYVHATDTHRRLPCQKCNTNSIHLAVLTVFHPLFSPSSLVAFCPSPPPLFLVAPCFLFQFVLRPTPTPNVKFLSENGIVTMLIIMMAVQRRHGISKIQCDNISLFFIDASFHIPMTSTLKPGKLTAV